jgi:hypothetical protein
VGITSAGWVKRSQSNPPRSKKLGVYLDDVLMTDLAVMANKEEVTPAELVRRLIRDEGKRMLQLKEQA